MDYLSVRTRGNSDSKGKPRVYFTCHPDDFEKYFDKVCNDLFESQDCAVYYTPNMTEEIPLDMAEVDLGSMNLFVIPVTYKLLFEPNRAMDFDYAFAERNHIAVLPLMMENGLDSYYANDFGERQYIKPFSNDLTEVDYSQKLRNYLDSTLGTMNENMIKQIRASFEAHIFLSYRKKDRKFANDLIKKIHSLPAFRMLAIWYDEFIQPGEGFRDSIRSSMENSKLVLMLVTPNLVNESNFVQREEYPMAKRLGKEVIPAVAKKTSHSDLKKQYPGISDCIDADDTKQLSRKLLRALDDTDFNGTIDTPERSFLIGLAYLYGIDAEVDRERAVALLTDAANNGYEKAIEVLRSMYAHGDGVALDYQKALTWAKKLVEFRKRIYGNAHSETLKALSLLAIGYIDCGEYINAIQAHHDIYESQKQMLGAEHPDTLETLHNLAVAYGSNGDRAQAREFYKEAYLARQRVLGEDNYLTQTSLFGYASNLDDLPEAIRLLDQVYSSMCRIRGEKDLNTIAILINMGNVYGEMSKFQESADFLKYAYSLLCDTVGKKHPKALDVLDSMVISTMALQKYDEALNYAYALYSTREEVLGKDHPDTIRAMFLLSAASKNAGNYQDAISFGNLAYSAQASTLGENHKYTIQTLINIVDAYALSSAQNNDYNAAKDYRQKKFLLEKDLYGQDNPQTLNTLADIAMDCVALKDYENAREYQKIVYEHRCKVLGEKDPQTLDVLLNYAISCAMLGYVSKAFTIAKAVYDDECEVLGSNHPTTQRTLSLVNQLARMC